jgi:hypothetical protein
LSSLWPYRLVVWAYVRCCRLLGIPYLRFFIKVFSGMLSHGHLFHAPVIRPLGIFFLLLFSFFGEKFTVSKKNSGFLPLTRNLSRCNWSNSTERNPRSLTILNYMKQIEGRGRLTEGVQYYFINIVVSVKLKKKIWKIVSNFIIFIWIYFDLPVFTLKK